MTNPNYITNPKTIRKYEQYAKELYKVTAEKTGLSEREVKINEKAAKEWYDSGATPYITFRETFANEG